MRFRRIRQVLFAQGLSVAAVGLGATRTLFLLALLGPQIFGIYSTLYHSAALLGAFAGLNTGDYLSKECPGLAIQEQRGALRRALIVSLPGSMLALAVAAVAFFGGWIHLPLSGLGFWLLSGAAIASMLLLILQGYLYGLDRIYAAQTLNFLITFGWFIVLAPASWFGLNVTLEVLFGTWFLVDVLVLAAYAWTFRDRVFGPRGNQDEPRRALRETLMFCLALYPRNFSKTLMSLGDRYALLGLGQLRALSFLSVLKEAVAVAANLGNQLSTVMSPSYFRIVRTSGAESEAAKRNTARLLWLSTLVTFPAALGLWGFAPDIVRLLHGQGFLEMVIWIAPVPLLWTLITVLERWYIVSPLIKYLAAVRFFSTLLYTGLAFLVARLSGPDAVTSAMLGTFMLIFLALLIPRGLRRGFAWREIPYLQLGVFGVLSTIVLIPLARSEGLPFALRIAIFGAVYGLFLVGVIASAPQARAELRRQWATSRPPAEITDLE